MSDDHLILKDSKSSPELIGGLTIEDERQAELTLLMLLEDMPQEDRVPFLKENNISYEEFNRIYEKWFRVLERYRKEKADARTNETLSPANNSDSSETS
jgi:hypothetical protein